MQETAFKMLFADRGKLLVSVVGVVFAVMLVNIQGGLFLGLIRKASLLVDQGEAEVWVGHRNMNNVDFPQDIPREWVHRIRGVPGVSAAEPYIVGHSVMTLPSGGFEQVLVVGCDPNSLLGGASVVVEGDPFQVREPDAVLLDAGDLDKLEYPAVGEVREIGRQRARVVGLTEGLLGFLVTPYVFTDLENAAGYLRKSLGTASYFLVKLEGDADPQEVCRLIRERLPDAETMTRGEYAKASVTYWLTRTGIGLSFGAATALGLLVGLVIVAQTLYASVLDRKDEYATLKAVGAKESQIRAILLYQALLLAMVGSSAGLALVSVLQASFDSPRAPIAIPPLLSLGSCLLVSALCFCGALAPYFRLRRLDPATVLQS